MRKVLIFGATSAIARETARLFARDGDFLFLVARDGERLRAVAKDLAVRGAKRVECFTADINRFDLHERILPNAIESLGGLDVVLVAHGSLPNQEACEKEYAEAEEALRTNFLSVVSLLTPIANFFEKEGRGSIAVISSVAGDRCKRSNYLYGTAKGAVSLFMQGLRNRLAPRGVQVLTVKPGYVDTPMTAHMEKTFLLAEPEAVAKGIARAIRKRKDVVYLPFYWRFIMSLIRLIPERRFKRMGL